jgi:uncharacterized membrane protein YdjX (TVP38/TMEM64 family)
MSSVQKEHTKLMVFLALLGLSFFWASRLDWHSYFSATQIGNTVEQLRQLQSQVTFLGPLPFCFMGTILIVANVPTVLIILLASLLFPIWQTIVISTLCFALSISLIYLIANYFSGPWSHAILDRYTPRIQKYISQNEFYSVLQIRLIFFALPPINWLLGMMNLNFSAFFWGSVLGALPNIVFWGWLSGTVVELLVAGQSLDPRQSPELWAPVIFSISLLLTVRIWQRISASR